MSTLTTADLPAGLRAPVEADTTAVAVLPNLATSTPRVQVLTCEHGPACPSCVLTAARLMIDADATLSREVYTG